MIFMVLLGISGLWGTVLGLAFLVSTNVCPESSEPQPPCPEALALRGPSLSHLLVSGLSLAHLPMYMPGLPWCG